MSSRSRDLRADGEGEKALEKEKFVLLCIYYDIFNNKIK